MPEREGLTARISQIRRAWAHGDERRRTGEAEASQAQAGQSGDVHALELRVAALEQLVQGLQDSVHREATRVSKRLTVVEAQLQPAALGRALSEDARERGL